jgi:iron complex transport system ATP-binding protein
VAEVLSLDNVSVVRGQTSILTKVSWTFAEGERWVIMGPNGAGKTTLLQVCAGYIHPTRGTAQILGQTLGATDVRDLRTRIGICSTAVAALLPADESVRDTVMSAAHGVSGRWRERYDSYDEQRAAALIDMWGLSALGERTIGTLSEGERKRVLIARSLMSDPELLLLDEPAAGLDVAGREDLITRLSVLADNPAAPALVLVTHHVEEIPPNFTHAMLMSHGTVTSRGSIHTVIDSGPMSEAFELPLIIETVDDRWFARAWRPSRGRRAR